MIRRKKSGGSSSKWRSRGVRGKKPLRKKGTKRPLLRRGKKRTGTRIRRTGRVPQHPVSYNQAYDEGFDSAYNEGFDIGYHEGMAAGHQEASKGA
ncbi:hypothetical protein [Cohnella cholangitidis]|uniref:Uncharacterized protein n=1 Tax=Cohnella cholangitidis TaxID=2598458 RepID=A0A7G5BUY7_9BACL|nr:hypothetical protein [Cohnella cholangitidis]QMV40771.1 hypothetical protein FPL14_05805 [Cohnella cholangitidis]